MISIFKKNKKTMNVHMDIENNLECGTTFYFTFPVGEKDLK